MESPLELSKRAPKQLLLEALKDRWKGYRRERKRCRDEFSEEVVHDLRVATRRMLALIELLHSISPRPRLRKLSRAFKAQLDAFDDLRDTQVILAELSEILRELPQLQAFQKHLQFSEGKMLRVLRKKIKRQEVSEVIRRIRKTLESIEAENSEGLDTQIMQAVDDAFLITRRRLEWVDPAHSSTIHRVRIAFKAFRYMVEIAHPLLSGFPAENLKRMNDYQSLMGEVQDAEVFAQTLVDYAENSPIPDHERVRCYYEDRHAEAISAYVRGMEQLHTFWRPAPDQPFPWEKTE